MRRILKEDIVGARIVNIHQTYELLEGGCDCRVIYFTVDRGFTFETPSAGPGDEDAGDEHDGPIRGLPVVWSSIGYRVLEDNASTNVAWGKSSIDQAFTQSPYLGSK